MLLLVSRFCGLKSGSGGIGFYKDNLNDIGDKDITLEEFVNHFFGPDWKVAPLPTTQPKLEMLSL